MAVGLQHLAGLAVCIVCQTVIAESEQQVQVSGAQQGNPRQPSQGGDATQPPSLLRFPVQLKGCWRMLQAKPILGTPSTEH